MLFAKNKGFPCSILNTGFQCSILNTDQHGQNKEFFSLKYGSLYIDFNRLEKDTLNSYFIAFRALFCICTYFINFFSLFFVFRTINAILTIDYSLKLFSSKGELFLASKEVETSILTRRSLVHLFVASSYDFKYEWNRWKRQSLVSLFLHRLFI